MDSFENKKFKGMRSRGTPPPPLFHGFYLPGIPPRSQDEDLKKVPSDFLAGKGKVTILKFA